jgi:hypothetical protein
MYRPRWLRFVLTHAEEVSDSGMIPAHLYQEFEHLPSGRICTCDRVQLAAETAQHAGTFESRMPGASWLDIKRAYSALPMGSQGRTTVWLLLQGVSEQAQYDMGLHGFLVRHRERIKQESGQQKSPDPQVEDRGSPWEQMARYLNGDDPP